MSITSPSAGYTAEEESPEQKPIELYQFTRQGITSYFTNYSKNISWDGNTYITASISREEIEEDDQRVGSKCKIKAVPNLYLKQFLVFSPFNTIEVKIYRVYDFDEDQSLADTEVMLSFRGTIDNLVFNNGIIEGDCSFFGHKLQNETPVYRWMLKCNHELYGTKCQVDKDQNYNAGSGEGDFRITDQIATIAIATRTLTASKFSNKAIGFFNRGFLSYNPESSAPAVEAPLFIGSGLNDASSSGTYTDKANDTYEVILDGLGTPDTFKWRKGFGAFTTGVTITGAAQTLSDGVEVTFAATTGHDLDDKWLLKIKGFSEIFIADHVTTTIILQYIPFGLSVGTEVTVYAGCAKSRVIDCRTKFDQEPFFGGMHSLPAQNPALVGVLEPREL